MVQKKLFFCIITAAIFIGCFFNARPSFAVDRRSIEKETVAVLQENINVDEIIVKFKAGSKGKVRSLSNRQEKIVEDNSRLGVSRIKLASGQSLNEVLDYYKRNSNVEYAEPNYIYKMLGEPNDPDYDLQWALPKIETPSVWEETYGEGVVIAIIDTGVDVNHPEFAGKIVCGYNNTTSLPGEEGLSVANDDNGHGTHVAGICAAGVNNEIGIAGVAGKATIMPVKVLDNQGEGYLEDIADGIKWAADHGADIINLSLGAPNDSITIKEAVEYAYNMGIVIVAAAGNEGTENVLYPAAMPHVIGVAGSSKTDELVSSSSWGDGVDVSAPGEGIYSTLKGSAYCYYTGTSMAAPHVSGIAALVISKHPTYSNAQIEEAIEASAEDFGIGGWDPEMGFGRVNAYGALHAVLPVSNETVEDNTIAQANSLSVGESAASTISVIDDADWYSVSLDAGNLYKIVIEPPAGMDGIVEVYDSGGELVDTVDYYGCGEKDSIMLTPSQTETYFLKVFDFNARWSADPYHLSVMLDNTLAKLDLNGDGAISITDLNNIAGQYGSKQSDGTWIPAVDLNSDLVVDIFDLIYLSHYLN